MPSAASSNRMIFRLFANGFRHTGQTRRHGRRDKKPCIACDALRAGRGRCDRRSESGPSPDRRRGAKPRKEHCEAWKHFWLRSYMETGDVYLDNLWHLTMYYAAASQRGAYPGNFINGLGLGIATSKIGISIFIGTSSRFIGLLMLPDITIFASATLNIDFGHFRMRGRMLGKSLIVVVQLFPT